MKRIKHILVLVGLFFAAMPCCTHADGHTEHNDETIVLPELSCCGHACEKTVCPKDLDVEKERTFSSVSVYRPCPPKPLFTVFAVTALHMPCRPVLHDVLSELKTVRLLT
ncbi:hypothetical protein EGM51_14310 [Verrucomicrobia bacterium S94]|nr:hypothetical protein EGM51_14310 [Verrucomicrobia bacterium S94]